MNFLKMLNQKKLAKAMLCGVLLSGGMLVGMEQAGASVLKVDAPNTFVGEAYWSSASTYNFYIGKDVGPGATMANFTGAPLSGGVDFADKTINAGVQTGSKLEVGDSVCLISIGGEGITNFERAKTGMVTESDYRQFGLKIYQEGGNTIFAEVTSLHSGDLTEESKSPVETQAAGLTMLTTGADMLAGQSFDNAATAVASEVSAGGSASTMTPFVAMGGAKNKVKSGSHVDVKGWNINLGFAKELDNKAGKLLIGPVLEYGRGSYDSYLDNGYHGNGDTKYIGGGVMAKQTNDDGFYYEGSLRAGKLDNDYSAYANSYDSSSAYFTAHVGAGKVVKLSAKNSLDYYGKYFFTHQAADTTTLHAGGFDYRLHFDGVNSNRTRVGGRFIHDLTAKDAVYVGLAWQHEFSGTARATIDGAGTPAPSVKGDTGIMELGWKVSANDHLDLDLGATGSVGKQKGAGLNLSVNFKF